MRRLSPDVNDIAGADFIGAALQPERARPAADEKHLVSPIVRFARACAAFPGIQRNRKVRALVNGQRAFYFGKVSVDLRALQDVMNLASQRRCRGYRQRGSEPYYSHMDMDQHAPISIPKSVLSVRHPFTAGGRWSGPRQGRMPNSAVARFAAGPQTRPRNSPEQMERTLPFHFIESLFLFV